jgi:hypothetical protein
MEKVKEKIQQRIAQWEIEMGLEHAGGKTINLDNRAERFRKRQSSAGGSFLDARVYRQAFMCEKPYQDPCEVEDCFEGGVVYNSDGSVADDGSADQAGPDGEGKSHCRNFGVWPRQKTFPITLTEGAHVYAHKATIKRAFSGLFPWLGGRKTPFGALESTKVFEGNAECELTVSQIPETMVTMVARQRPPNLQNLHHKPCHGHRYPLPHLDRRTRLHPRPLHQLHHNPLLRRQSFLTRHTLNSLRVAGRMET